MAKTIESKTTRLGKAVNLSALKRLATQIDSAKGKLDDARMANAELYKQAEDQGFHRQALKMALKLRAMEPAKRNDFLDSLQAYCEIFGVFAQGDLLGDAPAIPQPGDGAGDADPPPAVPDASVVRDTAMADQEVLGTA